MGKKRGGGASGKVAKFPKMECCSDKPQCGRCPLRMLKEGTLPDGYTVKKRKLVRVDGTKLTKKMVKQARKSRARVA